MKETKEIEFRIAKTGHLVPVIDQVFIHSIFDPIKEAEVFARKLPKNLWENLDIGGKTGQMTGGIPEGKRDWFIAFARPKSHPQDLGISIAVMVVNQERWYIRSTQLAKEIIQYYFNNLFVLSSPSNYYSYHKKK